MSNLFIVRYPEHPVNVPRTERVTIGRAENNTIVLTEARISRLHALIEWREVPQQFVIMDLGSANGTMLNGERLSSTQEYPLKDWDKVRIASAVFTIRTVQSPDLIRQEFMALSQRIHNEATQVVSRTVLKGTQAQPAFSGTLEHLCPIDLFQMLEAGRKTGRLHLKADQGEGVFSLLRGALAAARFGEKDGEEAVFSTLTCNKGSFAFVPQDEASIEKGSQFSRATTALLMEGCRLLDERAAAQLKEKN